MKRIRLAAILAAAVLTLSLCACDILSDMTGIDVFSDQGTVSPDDLPLTDGTIDYHVDGDGYWIIDKVEYQRSSLYDPLDTPYSYLHLTERSEEMRSLYGALSQAVYCLSDKPCDDYSGLYELRPLVINGIFSGKTVANALTSVLNDEPQIFWMTTDFVLSTDEKKQQTTVELHSSYTPQQVVRMVKELNTSLSSFYSGITANMTPYEREEYVYTYLIKNCTYDDNVSSDGYGDDHPSIYDLYGAMVDRKAVCEGYSRAFDYLCSQLGVETVCICGTSDTENDDDVDVSSGLHMWNAVQLDGEWYWADCTWDDWDEDEDLGDVFYYLNITDDVLFADHTVDKTYDEITEDEYEKLKSYINSFVPPACIATEYCYYLREGVTLTAPDAEKLAEGFVTAVNQNRKSLIVIIDNDRYTPDSMIDALFDGSQPYYEALDLANEWLGETRLDADADAVYYTDDDRKMLIFEICYE